MLQTQKILAKFARNYKIEKNKKQVKRFKMVHEFEEASFDAFMGG